MAFTLSGDFGAATFSSSTDDSGRVTNRYLSFDTEADLNFFRRVSIVKSSITLNSFGLFSFLEAGNNNSVRFAHLTKPKHLFSKRTSGCVWSPKGRVRMDVDEITLCPIVYKGQHCPDAFFGSCLERLYGVGNDNINVYATPAGDTIMGELTNRIFEALGDSLYELVWYGQHPIIDDADANDWQGVDDQEWEDYKDQQESCGGILTIVDWFKQDGLTNFNVPIHKEDISADRTEYIGVVTDLFDRVLNAQSTEMKILSKRGDTTGTNSEAVLLVDRKIFTKYENELADQYVTIPEMFYYRYNGQFCQAVGCNENVHVKGTLRYKGHLIVCMDEWEDFDHITGTVTFRCLAVIPGNFGVAFDVPSLTQGGTYGLRLTQRLDDPWEGQVFMSTRFKVGMGVIEEKYLVNASRTFSPLAA